MSIEKKWSHEVSQFTTSERLKQKRYRGTWRWDVGYTDNIMPSFPIRFVEKASHGYTRLKSGTGFKGPVIENKMVAIKQAQIALASAMIEDAERSRKENA